jgi:heterodisulfide reductase subunit A
VLLQDGKLQVTVYNPVLRENISFHPDLLALSTATVPADTAELASMLKVPRTADGFFLEAHMKLRPVDFATEGVFLCGMAHSPKYVDESIAQACAAAARATTILSRDKLEMEGIVANVNEDLCSGCRVCEYLCPYGAVEMKDKDGKLIAT